MQLRTRRDGRPEPVHSLPGSVGHENRHACAERMLLVNGPARPGRNPGTQGGAPSGAVGTGPDGKLSFL